MQQKDKQTNNKKQDTKSHIQALQEEIQDLESQILDMFEVAFHFAGLQPEYIHEALKYYMEVMESQSDDLPYTAKTIIANILLIKQDRPQWFIQTL